VLVHLNTEQRRNLTNKRNKKKTNASLRYPLSRWFFWQVPNPDDDEVRKGHPTVYDTWLERGYRSPVDKQKPNIPITGSGSDHAAFVGRLGVSSVDLRFTFDPALNISSYPVYHSAYETSYYYETLIDPRYKVCTMQYSF